MYDTLTATATLRCYVFARSFGVHARHALASDERGEGVISAAIAVLVMAFLGAMMWLAFKGIFSSASKSTEDQVGKIGG